MVDETTPKIVVFTKLMSIIEEITESEVDTQACLAGVSETMVACIKRCGTEMIQEDFAGKWLNFCP